MIRKNSKYIFVFIIAVLYLNNLEANTLLGNCYRNNDSLNIELFNLVNYSKPDPTGKLLKDVEDLIKKGANPNAELAFDAKSLKPGARLVVVSIFMKDKYKKTIIYSTPFHAAVKTGNIKLVEKLLSMGARPDIATSDNRYPIDEALTKDDSDMVFFLLENGVKIEDLNPGNAFDTTLIKELIIKGANPNLTNKYGEKLIERYTKVRDGSMIIFLLKHGVDPSSVDMSGLRDVDLIETLVSNGANPKTININFTLSEKEELIRLLKLKPNLETLSLDFYWTFRAEGVLDLLLDNGLNPHIKGNLPEVPLICGAIYHEDTIAINTILKNGVDINYQYQYSTPLLYAIEENKPEMIHYLLRKGADPNIALESGFSAIYIAAKKDDTVLLKILTDTGVDIESKTYKGITPLMYALSKKSYNAAKALIKLGANLNCNDEKGTTPIIYAIKKKNYELTLLMIKKGADVNAISSDKKSVLIHAIETDNEEIIKQLIETGAETEYVGFEEETPLMYAINQKKEKSARALIENGANVNFVNKLKQSTLILAIKNDDLATVKLLVEHGADTKFKYQKYTPVKYAKRWLRKSIAAYLEQFEN